MHRLPVELVLDTVEFLEEDDRDKLQRTCKWLEAILPKRGRTVDVLESKVEA